jgi:cysteine-S-conjugate beta-lyase
VALRYRAHDMAARQLARWCQTQPAIVQVLHPALPGSPGHAHWWQLCVPDGAQGDDAGGAAGLFSILLDPRYSRDQVDAFCDALKLFKLGYSWGGPISLVVPYELHTMRQRWPSGVAQGHLIRFSVGLEAVADLQADVAQALARLGQF